ncbi:MAG: phosphoglycerate kinase [Clostridia bacterium]|nr:phosphoglycerate kinase [Clostridia bacterium]
MQKKLTIEDFKLEGKRVLLRVDYNVPLNSNGVITNDKRIRESIPTLQYLVGQKAKIIICSHLGRPEGKVVPELSLRAVADRLGQLIKLPVVLAHDIAGVDTHKLIRGMDDGDIIMLENLRFDPGEEENSVEFAKKLAAVADIYCNDAFGSMHRAHASTARITEFLPSCIGFLVERELEMFSEVMENPKRPFVVVVGGSKVKDKIALLSNMIAHADSLLIGGAMAYTFMKAKGYDVGSSTYEEDKIQFAKLLLEKAEKCGTEVLLPIDHVVADEFNFAANTKIITSKEFKKNDIGMDIGPKTVKLYSKIITRAKTVFWNGPMGVFEFQKFAEGTAGIAQAMANCGKNSVTIVGGGDSASAIEKLGFEMDVSHVSTGGGASLKFLEGASLPGLDVIGVKHEEV